ncbi:DedA family protein [Leptolyngbya sp. 'hensonii']|uniref:DedA family protein n=1 Tax=Leptolyngbya sp. 'hensonii' TaxID=1922337 RepID=UPI00094F6627|nr:DedA family protein [Leptolyngbya sp. 'hensonii']OLP19904.1 DedA family protein [Leptolyngbya sp. 'hensonii']
MALEFLTAETVEQIAQDYGYWAVFAGILLENLGLPLPGETITLAGGFLAGSGQLDYWFVWGSAAAGAALGGNFGYWIGRLGGWPLLVRIGQVFRFRETQLIDLREKFSRNAGRTVFVGRFIALLRIFASPLAGIAGMPYLRFTLYNLTGALAWASIMVTLAFFAGRLISLEQLITWVSQFAVLALAIAIGVIVVPFWLETRQTREASSGEGEG